MSSLRLLKNNRGNGTIHIECMWPGLEKLTLEQRFALHEFKTSVAASMFRLYQSIPVKQADEILDMFFKPIPTPTKASRPRSPR
jgi:hypothetical protein